MNILLAVDGSKHARNAERALVRIAGARAHRVTAAYVCPAGRDAALVFLRQAGKDMLAKISADMSRRSRLKVAPDLRESHHPARALLDAAKGHDARLIVLGARGLTPLKAFLLGGVSRAVAQRAERAVLVVRAGKAAAKPLKVLAAVDGSAASLKALSVLKDLAGRPCRVTLLHAVELPVMLPAEFGGPMFSGRAFDDVLKQRRRRGERLLAALRKKWAREFEAVKTRRAEGHVADAILRAAREEGADLIVLGRRGLSAVERFALGSVSQTVLDHAPCSVLMVP